MHTIIRNVAGTSLILGVCVLSYALTTVVPPPYKDLAALPLFPGLALYVALNGSLLFGSGFGGWGNGLIIVGGSAVFWGVLLAAIRWRMRRKGASS